MALDTYFEPQLIELIDTITRSTNSLKEKSSMLYENLRCSRVCMIIALLCFTMNHQCCFIQTIVGLMCYGYGLRDKGFVILNTMGRNCSIDHIRSHGSYWASRHIHILQLNTKKFWRITIDNLNFYLKFSKSLPESSSGAKKNVESINWTSYTSRIHRNYCPKETLTVIRVNTQFYGKVYSLNYLNYTTE